MENVVQWVVENWMLVVGLLYAALNFANAIVKLTPSEKDDSIVAKIMAVMDRLSFLTNKNAAGTVKAPLFRSKPVEYIN